LDVGGAGAGRAPARVQPPPPGTGNCPAVPLPPRLGAPLSPSPAGEPDGHPGDAGGGGRGGGGGAAGGGAAPPLAGRRPPGPPQPAAAVRHLHQHPLPPRHRRHRWVPRVGPGWGMVPWVPWVGPGWVVEMAFGVPWVGPGRVLVPWVLLVGPRWMGCHGWEQDGRWSHGCRGLDWDG